MFGLFKRDGHDGEQTTQLPPASPAAGVIERYLGRHAHPQGLASRARLARIVPAAGAAVALVAGAGAYALVAGGGHAPATQLSADMSLPVNLGRAAHGGVGVDSVASTMIRASKTAARPVGTDSATPSASASRSPRAAAASTAARPAASKATAAPKPAATHRVVQAQASAAPAPAPAPKTLSCNLSDGLLPDNVTAIVTFLIAHGYSDNAAAGIAGNMYQESKGNPESEGMGGGGLIGFTPLPAGYVTGNAAVDLETQLEAVLTYNQQWAGYLPALNDASSPASAAYIYVTDFERAGIPAASTREASAEDVASACGI